MEKIERKTYLGAKSTLCTGCGHDSITNNIVSALYQSQIPPHQIAKISGIGCSSKTTTYFSNSSHGFNSLHGRMAPVATGAKLANSSLNILGVSGDGDSASIGLSGFTHSVRRNIPMVYIVENNGVYGLTKGQFSATAHLNAPSKSGLKNPFTNIDLCNLALTTGCDFVARAFSGDAKQLVPILLSALKHPGTAVIDIISPCVAFNNHDGSEMSYDYLKTHLAPLQKIDIINEKQPIEAAPDKPNQVVKLHDGTQINLIDTQSIHHDVTSRIDAVNLLMRESDESVYTGILYINKDSTPYTEKVNLTKTPLYQLGTDELKPSKEQLSKTLSHFK